MRSFFYFFLSSINQRNNDEQRFYYLKSGKGEILLDRESAVVLRTIHGLREQVNAISEERKWLKKEKWTLPPNFDSRPIAVTISLLFFIIIYFCFVLFCWLVCFRFLQPFLVLYFQKKRTCKIVLIFGFLKRFFLTLSPLFVLNESHISKKRILRFLVIKVYQHFQIQLAIYLLSQGLAGYQIYWSRCVVLE